MSLSRKQKTQSVSESTEREGALAHLVERMHGMHEVVSSSLICSTKQTLNVLSY